MKEISPLPPPPPPAPPPPEYGGPVTKGLSTNGSEDSGVIVVTAVAHSEDGLNVAQAEYWVGDDPGPGNGKPMKAVGRAFKSSRVDITVSIDISQLKEGEHRLNVRSADIRGVWGDPQTITFTVPKKEEANPPEEQPVEETKTGDTTDEGQPLKERPDTKKPELPQEPPPPPKPHLLRNVIIGASIAVCLIVGYIMWPKGKAEISVSSKPSGASLIIDGENRGQTPKTGISVSTGTHHIVLEKKGYPTTEQDVIVKSGEKKSLTVTLKKNQQKNRPPIDDSSSQNIVTNPDKGPPPANPSIPINNEREIASFLERYLKDTETRDVNLILSHYGEQVDYFSKGIVKKDFIKKDKELYFKRWTTIVNTLEGQPEIQETSQDKTRVVRFASQFLVKNEKQSITGRADNTWTLKRVNNEWKIVGEKQRVLSRDKN